MEKNHVEKKIQFAKNLKECRSIFNVSAKELADRLNVAPTTVSMWECGKNFPDVLKLIELCDFFCVSVERLLFGTEQSILDGLTDMQKFLITHTIKEFRKLSAE